MYCYLCGRETAQTYAVAFALGPVCARCRDHPTVEHLEAAFQELQNAIDDLMGEGSGEG